MNTHFLCDEPIEKGGDVRLRQGMKILVVSKCTSGVVKEKTTSTKKEAKNVG